MAGAERRQNLRTTLGVLPYIDIEPENGALVSNVSEGGLCFQSVAPVELNKTIHFRFTDSGHRTGACGKVVWTDKTRTAGGLQFAPGLSADARQHIRKWIAEASSAQPSGEFPPVSVTLPQETPALRDSSNVSNANILDVKDKTINSIGAAYFSSNLKHLRHLGTFSRGFAAGFLLAVLTTGAFFFHSYRQELGESIIRVGERLAAKAQKQAQVAELPLALPFAEAPAQPALESTAIQHSAQQHPAIQAEPQRAKVPDSNPDLVRMFTVLAPMRRPLPTASSSGLEKASSLEPPEIVFPSTGLAPSSSMILRKSNAMPQLAGSTQLENPEPETYLEVARFKDEFEAHKTMETLERIGLHASVIRKGRLWIDSYYVLVGPYREAGEARAARKTLVSRGFKPRSLERGTRSFGLGSELRLTNLPVPLENFVVNWESYTNDAVVNFVQDNTLVATADARWVRHRCNSDHNAIVYSNNRDGSRTLLEFHFRGMPRALALGNFLDAVSSGGASCCRDSLASGGSPSRSSSRPGSM